LFCVAILLCPGALVGRLALAVLGVAAAAAAGLSLFGGSNAVGRPLESVLGSSGPVNQYIIFFVSISLYEDVYFLR
jgi:hypothetical protein